MITHHTFVIFRFVEVETLSFLHYFRNFCKKLKEEIGKENIYIFYSTTFKFLNLKIMRKNFLFAVFFFQDVQ